MWTWAVSARKEENILSKAQENFSKLQKTVTEIYPEQH